MPDAVKSLAKQFVDTHQMQPPPTGKQSKTPISVVKSIGQNMNSRNQNESNLMNRSMSQKQIGQQQQQSNSYNQTGSNSNSSLGLPQLSGRITEIANQHFDNIEKIQSMSHAGLQNKFMNLAIKQGMSTKNLGSSSLQPNSNRLSPIPSVYKEYLPNIIKKKINDATTTSFNFNPRDKLIQGKKETQKKNIEFLQSQLRSDVSYLKEAIQNPTQQTQPTILTTGDKKQDELLEVTMGYKNLGKSLIDLPQSLEELTQIALSFDKNIFKHQKMDQEERLYEQYLNDNFKPLDILEKLTIEGGTQGILNEYSLPNNQLSQYVNKGQISSRFLNNQQQTTKNNNLSQQMFNFQDKRGSEVQSLDKTPPFVSTRPDNLKIINSKIMNKFGKEAFMNNFSPDKLENKTSPSKTKKQVETLNNSNSKSRLSILNEMINPSKPEEKPAFLDDTKRGLGSHSHSPINIHGSRNPNANKTGVITQFLSTQSSQASLGNPSSRQDALLLIVWFEKMLTNIQNDLPSDQREDKLFPLMQLVMNICVKELCRQVSVQCIERGLILSKVFESYIRLIDLIHKDHRKKRKTIKTELSIKLDKYITVLQDQLTSYKDQLDEYKYTQAKLKGELDDCLWKLRQGNNLLTKFKKKCYNAQKDFEGAQRKLKFVEKENQDLKQRLTELSEQLGEDMYQMDENDKRRMMLQIEEELAGIEDDALSKGDVQLSEEDINKISDNAIIKEEERHTDMNGFEDYLRMMFGEKKMEVEIQTDKVTKRHMKLGVTSTKLGILRDKETFIDPRMFEDPNQVKQYKIITNNESNPLPQVPVQELYDEFAPDEDELLEDDEQDEENEQLLDDDDELIQDLGIEPIEGKMDETRIKRMGIKRNKRSASNIIKVREFGVQDIDEDNIIFEPQYGTSEVDKIITSKDAGLDPLDNEDDGNTLQIKIKNPNPIHSRASQQQLDQLQPQTGQTRKNKLTQLQQQEQKKLSLMEIFAQRIRQRLKDYINSKDLEDLKIVNPEFISKLQTDLVHTSKEITQINDEFSRKDRALRYSQKNNRKNEKNIKGAHDRVDYLELENYNLREQLVDLMKQFDEYRAQISDILKLLDRDTIGQLTINEIRRQLVMLNDKINNSQQKYQQNSLQEEDILLNESKQMQNRTFESSQALPNLNKDLIEDQGVPTTKQIPINFKKHFRLIMDDLEIDQPDQLQIGSAREGRSMNRTGEKFNSKAKFTMPMNKNEKRSSPSKGRGSHPAYVILKKIQSKDKKKLKDIMPRKMLLRIIFQIYSEKGYFDLNMVQANQNNPQSLMGQTAQTFSSQLNSATSLLEWVYDSFMQKYGIKTIAERKFVQLISSCIIQQEQLPRIRLFGRFIEAYDELPVQDYNKYLEITEMYTQQILNFKIEDDMDSVLLPLHRAIDYYRLKFEGKFLTHAFNQRIQKLEKMKVIVGIEDVKEQKHLKGIREAVDLDRFCEFVIDSYIYLSEERETQIKEIYLAVDINNDGVMSYAEFQMLMKVFHYKSAKEIWKLFDEFAVTGLDPQNPFIKYLNLDCFTKLATEKEYFTPKAQYYFCKSKNVDKDFEKLQEELSVVTSLFRARLTAIDLNQEFEYLEIIENFQNNIKYPFSTRVGWLCYRIVDEILKRLYLKKMSDFYMPADLKQIGMKVKPSQQLLSSLPLNFFDTLQQ